MPGEKQLASRWKTLTFFAADLKYEELRQTYNAVREYVGGKGTKGFQYKDIETLRLVEEEMGGPLQIAKMKFWQVKGTKSTLTLSPGEILTLVGLCDAQGHLLLEFPV